LPFNQKKGLNALLSFVSFPSPPVSQKQELKQFIVPTRNDFQGFGDLNFCLCVCERVRAARMNEELLTTKYVDLIHVQKASAI